MMMMMTMISPLNWAASVGWKGIKADNLSFCLDIPLQLDGSAVRDDDDDHQDHILHDNHDHQDHIVHDNHDHHDDI